MGGGRFTCVRVRVVREKEGEKKDKKERVRAWEEGAIMRGLRTICLNVFSYSY